MLVIDPVLLLLILVVVGVSVGVVGVLSGRIRRSTQVQQEKVGELASGVERAIGSIRTIRAAGAADREQAAISATAADAYAAGVSVAKASSLVVPIAGVALQLSLLVVLGVGGLREVDMLKGANMSYRRAAIERLRFDTRLRGAGAQVHNDMGFSMRVQRDGWKLVYDPAIAVDHFPAERFDDDRRDAASLNAISNGAYNMHLILREHLPPVRREIAWWWWTLVGTRVYPGLAHVLLSLHTAQRERIREHWRAVRRGARDARRANLAPHRAAMPPVTS